MKTKEVLLLASALLLSIGLFAKDGGVLGTVVSRIGRTAIPGAKVSIEAPNKSAISLPDGAFSLGGLEPGSYTLKIEALGYETSTIVVKVSDYMRNMNMIILVPEVEVSGNDENDLAELDTDGEGIDSQATNA